MTLLPKSPTLINGYLNESYASAVRIGETVRVSSYSGTEVLGHVVSIGSRVIQIPERLLRIPSLMAWGREVQIRVPQENKLISGEKVAVTKVVAINLFKKALATDRNASNKSAYYKRPLEMPESIRKMKPEFSGLIYLKEIKRFLAISDDYPQDIPFLYMITEDGTVDDQVLDIASIGTVKDLESISEDNGKIYLMSSLSSNKRGLKEGRQWFIEVERRGLNLSVKNRREIGDLIFQSLPVDFLSKNFEVEAHAVINNQLFFAVKPALDGFNKFRIGVIRDVSRLFAGEDVEVEWRSPFELKFESELLITDMIPRADSFILATSCKGRSCSAIWQISESVVKSIYVSDEKHLEGIAITPHKVLYGVHDNVKTPHFFNFQLENEDF